jgi:hypothetical protein
MSRSFNPTFDATMDELLGHAKAHELPQVVLEGIVAILENPIKLFCWVGEAHPAGGSGTPSPPPSLYASDLLVKLVGAVRAFDWEVVAVILEQARSPLAPALLGRDR